MVLDLQSLFGLHVYICTHWLRVWDPQLPPPAFGLIYEDVLVSKDRRHLFVTHATSIVADPSRFNDVDPYPNPTMDPPVSYP